MSTAAFQRQLREIALERVRRIRERLAAGGPDARKEALREAHTLKGEARITGRADVAEVAHKLETKLGEHADPRVVQALLVELEALVEHAPDPSAAGLEANLRQTYLRIELEQVSELTRACSELRALHRDSVALADELTRMAHAETGSEPLSRALRAVASRARELTFEQDQRTEVLERDLHALRMLPVSRMFGHLKFAARQLASDLKKPLEVGVEGASLSIDRQVLDAIGEPLLHLVRNAVDHGLESVDERLSAGKPAVGVLLMRAEQVGRVVHLTVEDDGAGINIDAVRRELVASGRLTEAQANDERTNLLHWLFEPGFTTRERASQVSGRGFGLDIVRRRTEAIGGRVEVRSTLGAGTVFTVTVPVSMVADPVVVVEVDGAAYAFSTGEVSAVRRTSSLALSRAGDADVVRLGERLVPLRDLGELLGGRAVAERGAILVLRSDLGELALAVDHIQPVVSAVRRGLDPFLEGMAVVRGTVNMAGRLVALLDGRELHRRAERVGAGAVSEPPRATAAPRVLVVDDSELTRDVLVAALNDLGCVVQEAVDGAQALDRIGAAEFDLVLTDLDMPVMDGFELLSRIRARPETRRIPVVVLTTRASDSDLQRASELGADAYLIKATFQTAELANLIRLHVGEAS